MFTSLDEFKFTAEEKVLLGKVCGCDLVPSHTDADPELALYISKYENFNAEEFIPNPDTRSAAAALAEASITEDDKFVELYERYGTDFRSMATLDANMKTILLACFKKGIAARNGACANDLGALYYMGEVVPQDYSATDMLYNAAIDWGCYQSIINLGYMYEYGRIGKPDHQKAFQYYALAAALAPAPEALYKLGDMYSRGKVMERDLKKAVLLWLRSYNESESLQDKAQGAIRLAPLYLKSDAEDYGLTIDPLQSLHLYQEAEIGLRISIREGATYYEQRLQEAIAGQENARAIIDLTIVD